MQYGRAYQKSSRKNRGTQMVRGGTPPTTSPQLSDLGREVCLKGQENKESRELETWSDVREYRSPGNGQEPFLSGTVAGQSSPFNRKTSYDSPGRYFYKRSGMLKSIRALISCQSTVNMLTAFWASSDFLGV
ncbi:hypothetical protein AX15_003298 [Amanita polypyramis BW_CC]|nr:hypothetical protein AX15_003298 [Amanita polypyramis BW_CC]